MQRRRVGQVICKQMPDMDFVRPNRMGRSMQHLGRSDKLAACPFLSPQANTLWLRIAGIQWEAFSQTLFYHQS